MFNQGFDVSKSNGQRLWDVNWPLNARSSCAMGPVYLIINLLTNSLNINALVVVLQGVSSHNNMLNSILGFTREMEIKVTSGLVRVSISFHFAFLHLS